MWIDNFDSTTLLWDTLAACLQIILGYGIDIPIDFTKSLFWCRVILDFEIANILEDECGGEVKNVGSEILNVACTTECVQQSGSDDRVKVCRQWRLMLLLTLLCTLVFPITAWLIGVK